MVETSEGEVCKQCLQPHTDSSREHFTQGQYTDKKENRIFLIYKEIQSGAVAKPYMTNGLLIYGEIFVHFLIY
jgi:hypothetical protein